MDVSTSVGSTAYTSVRRLASVYRIGKGLGPALVDTVLGVTPAKNGSVEGCIDRFS
jgi:hypothetical protein